MKSILCFIATLFLAKKAFSVCTSSSITIDGYRYASSLDQYTYVDASEYCNREMDSGHLAHIKSENVSQAVDQLIRGCNQTFRIGLEYETGIYGSGWYWIGDVDEGIDPQPLLQEESRWATGEGEGSYNSGACVKPYNQTWIAVDDSSLQSFICETNMLIVEFESKEVYWKVGVVNELTWRVRSVDCLPSVSLYKDQNYNDSITPTHFISGDFWTTTRIPTDSEDDGGLYERVATCDDYSRIASTYAFIRAVTCSDAPDFPDANIGDGCASNSSISTSCNITCSYGYYVDGIAQAVCVDPHPNDTANFDGEWDYGDTKCTHITCHGVPTSVDNGAITPGCDDGSSYNTTCEIVCNQGYYVRGSGNAVCDDPSPNDDSNDQGNWDIGLTNCTPVVCSEEPEIPNGEVALECVGGSKFSTSCNITCNDRYTLSGIGRATCVDVNQTDDTNAYGGWDYGDTTCTPSPCDEICQFECRDNRTCLCIDEICTEVCPPCRNNSECLELQCRCKSGYQGINVDESNCVDIDECLDKTSCAAIGQSCQNLPGTYQCSCTEGYVPSGNGDDCIENRCQPTDCGANAGCYGNSTNDCSCFVGFKGKPEDECFDVDECASDVSACSDTEICRNTIGSYYCECIAGYTRTESDICIPNSCPPDVVRCSSSNFLIDLCDNAMDDVTNITFPSSLAGYSMTSETTCGEDTTNVNTPLGSRVCELDGTWSTVTWLMSCGAGISEVASQSIESEEQREQVSASLQMLTSNPETINSDDVALTSGAIQNLTSSTEDITETTATSVVTTISNLMESPGLDESGQSAELLTQLDLIASLVVLNNSDVYKAVSRNVSVVVTSSTTMESGVGVTMLVRPNSTTIGFRSDQFTLTTSSAVAGSVINGQRIQASIHIPKYALRDASKLSFNVIGNTNLFSTNSTAASLESSEVAEKINVSMLVLSATIENRNITNLPADGRLTYSLPVPYDNETQERSCVYWLESAGKWDDKGCSVAGSTPDTLTCSCDHLTNFAALLGDISGSPGLRVITIVGCSISAFALLILVFLFFCIPKTRTGKKFKSSFLLLNLSLALLGLNITLLVSEIPSVVSEEDDSISSSCRSIAVFLHCFLMATCAWMNCEAVMLILAVVKPIYAAQRLTDVRVVVASISWGWVMPAIFVSIVALHDISVYVNPQEYESSVTCWIHPDNIYLAVIPTAIMISANLIAYAILTYQLCLKHNAKLGKAKNSSKESYERKLGINFSILMLLGLTWIFGLFLPIEDKTTALAFAYIFTILNSLQGFFLLLLYIVRNEDVRQSVQTKLTTFSEIFAHNNTTSTISELSGKLNPSVTKEESSSNTDKWKSPYGEYVSTEVADPRTKGNYND